MPIEWVRMVNNTPCMARTHLSKPCANAKNSIKRGGRSAFRQAIKYNIYRTMQ